MTAGPGAPGAPGAPRWIRAFVDLAGPDAAAAEAFWQAVTGWTPSPRRGERDEFATLLPGDGDDVLRVQRLAAGPSRVHLDLAVADRAAAADRAVALGALTIGGGAPSDGFTALRSPAGSVFCLVDDAGTRRPATTTHGAGHRSRLAQVCLDVPAARHAAEVAFWSALTGWPPQPFSRVEDVVALAGDSSQAYRVILQRLGDGDGGPARAHLEWWTDDVAAEVARHVAVGAESVAAQDYWQVMRDPAGLPYCVIGRDPDTGLRAGT